MAVQFFLAIGGGCRVCIRGGGPGIVRGRRDGGAGRGRCGRCAAALGLRQSARARRRRAVRPDGSRIAVLSSVKGRRVILMLTSAMEPLRVFRRRRSQGPRPHLGRQRSPAGPRPAPPKTSTASTSPNTNSRAPPSSRWRRIRKRHASSRTGPSWSTPLSGITACARWGSAGTPTTARWVLTRTGTDYIFSNGQPHLYRVDVATNKPELVDSAADEDISRDWLVGRDGAVAARLDVDRTTGKWSIRAGNKTIANGQGPRRRGVADRVRQGRHQRGLPGARRRGRRRAVVRSAARGRNAEAVPAGHGYRTALCRSFWRQHPGLPGRRRIRRAQAVLSSAPGLSQQDRSRLRQIRHEHGRVHARPEEGDRADQRQCRERQLVHRRRCQSPGQADRL